MDTHEEIIRSAEELLVKVEEHRRLLSHIQEGASEVACHSSTLPNPYQANRKLKAAICETIEVLERTRKAFKSRQLEELRKKLTKILTEDY